VTTSRKSFTELSMDTNPKRHIGLINHRWCDLPVKRG
jgi:hypothetical protein